MKIRDLFRDVYTIGNWPKIEPGSRYGEQVLYSLTGYKLSLRLSLRSDGSSAKTFEIHDPKGMIISYVSRTNIQRHTKAHIMEITDDVRNVVTVLQVSDAQNLALEFHESSQEEPVFRFEGRPTEEELFQASMVCNFREKYIHDLYDIYDDLHSFPICRGYVYSFYSLYADLDIGEVPGLLL